MNQQLEYLLDRMDDYCRSAYNNLPLVVALMESIRSEWGDVPQPPEGEKSEVVERLAQAYMLSMGIQQLAERLDDLDTKLDKLTVVIDSLCDEIMGEKPVVH